MKSRTRRRRAVVMMVICLVLGGFLVADNTFPDSSEVPGRQNTPPANNTEGGLALKTLEQLAVKGRAPKTNYRRAQFGDGWNSISGCDTRNIILKRDLVQTEVNEKCQVISGTLHDPYTGEVVVFQRGATTSDDVQIDHVVALSDAWQKGAQQITSEVRIALSNDPLNLLAAKGSANQQKSDSDAASWLPPNKAFRCQYVARQIAVKYKYTLWVTVSERDAMQKVLSSCPDQSLPTA